MQISTRKQPRVLVVEDDPHSRSFLESSMELSGLEAVATASAEEAMKAMERQGLAGFQAVVSDYRLPGADGIELVRWIRERDEALSTLIITGQGEKSVVQESLAAGVFDYLEKPITHQDLRRQLWKAVERTQRERKSASDREGLAALERLDQSLNARIPADFMDRFQIYYQPLHEVGGDFFITHHSPESGLVLLIGDVAGHDIRSGFVSTYFQGMFRGCLESGASIVEALRLFNRSLRQGDLGNRQESEFISLSLSALQLSLPGETVLHWNYGFTPCQLAMENGRVVECPFGQFPLGWIEELDAQPHHLSTREASRLYVFTDGLVEWAFNLELNPLSLLYRLGREPNLTSSLPIEPTDDILAVIFNLNPVEKLKSGFEPLLSEHYAGTEIDHLDQLVSNWRRSLSFALDDRLGDRLYDLLICIREGMTNALVHGCERSAEKFAHLQISLNADQSWIRVVIDDPGRGHSFNLKERLEQLDGETGTHLGLGIIQHLSDDFYIDNRGTSLVFDFAVVPDKLITSSS